VVTELPLGRWTATYKKWLLEQMAEGRAPWQSFSEAHSERHVRFRLRLSRYMGAALQAQDEQALQAQLKLSAPFSLRNMHAFGADGSLVRFECPLQVIEHHAPVRLAAYVARKAHQLACLGDDLALLEARAAFVELVLRGEITLGRTPKSALVEELQRRDFAPNLGATPHYPRSSAADVPVLSGAGASGEVAGAMDTTPLEVRAASGRGYDYLLGMPLLSLTEERVVQLGRQVEKKRNEIHELSASSEVSLWQRELDELRAALESNLRLREVSREPALAGSGAAGSRGRKGASRPRKKAVTKRSKT